jgi:hypothetical protein
MMLPDTTLRTRWAIVVAHNGSPVLKVFAGQLKSSTGAEGYAYATGPTVVIAYNVAGASEGATAQEAFTTILDRLH